MPLISSPNPVRRVRARAAIVAVAVAVIAVLAPATSASAHVHVDGDDATRGGYGLLTFRVPTESDTASTVALTVTFPSATPITYVATQPLPGWTATVTTAKLDTPVETDDGEVSTYVSRVEWKADTPADGIKPGQFQLFNASAGPLPDVDSVTLPAVQTYSDGSTVAWNQTPTNGAEAEHPAPVLELAPAEPEGGSGTGGADATPTPVAAVAEAGVAGAPAWPGLVGLVAGVLGLVLGGAAFARTRGTPPPGTPTSAEP